MSADKQMRESEIHELKNRISELEDQVADLIDSKDALQAITDTAEDSIFIKGTDLKYSFVNPAMERVLGMSASELIGKTAKDVFGEEEAKIIATVDNPVLEGQTVDARRTLEINGVERTFHTVQTPVLDADKNIKAICGIVRDITEHMRGEEKIRGAELRFRSLIEQTTDAIFCYDFNSPIPTDLPIDDQVERFYDCKLAECNLVCAKYYGANSVEEVIGKNFRELFASTPDSFDKLVRQLIDSGYQVIDGEGIEKLPDGSERFYLNNASGIIEDGKLVRIWGTFRDITGRKLTEIALIENQELLRKIAENYPNSYLSIIEKDFTVGFTSGQEFKKQNLDPRQFEGLTLEQVFGDKAPIIRKHYENAFNGEECNFELFTNGQYQLYRVVPLISGDGSIPRILAVVENITERKQAEDQLHFLSVITEQVSDSIVTTDVDFKITYINQAFTNLYGYTKEDVLGKSPDILNADPLSLEIQAEIYNKISSGEVYQGEAINIRKDGSTFSCDMIIFPLVDENGKIFSYVGNQRDITERKRTEKALQESENKLLEAQKVAKLGYFVYDIKADSWTSSAELDDIFGMDKNYKRDFAGWQHIVHPDDRDSMLKYFQDDVLAKREKFDKEYKIINLKNGQEKYVHGMSSLELDENDNPITVFGTIQDITEAKHAEEALRMSEEKLRANNEELRVERQALHQKNIALKEVLEQIEAGKEQLASQIKSNVDRIIMPIINGLAEKQNGDTEGYINLLKSSLTDITSPFIGHLESEYSRLTSRQIEICNMVKNGMSCKEIASSLNISVQTVLKQRTLVRKKLGISNKKINLASYLKTMNKK